MAQSSTPRTQIKRVPQRASYDPQQIYDILTTTNTLMAELAQGWSKPHGFQLLQILFEEVLPPIG